MRTDPPCWFVHTTRFVQAERAQVDKRIAELRQGGGVERRLREVEDQIAQQERTNDSQALQAKGRELRDEVDGLGKKNNDLLYEIKQLDTQIKQLEGQSEARVRLEAEVRGRPPAPQAPTPGLSSRRVVWSSPVPNHVQRRAPKLRRNDRGRPQLTLNNACYLLLPSCSGATCGTKRRPCSATWRGLRTA